MRWRPFLVVFALMLPLSRPWLYVKGKVPVNGNVLREVTPNWVVTQKALTAGHVPLWNPFRDMGEPLLADPKTLAAYPLRWLLTPASSLLRFFQGWTLIHTFITACFGYLLAFHWHKKEPAAAATALLLAWNGFFMAHAPYPNLFASAAWMPAIFYAYARRSWAGLGAAMAIQWLAGYPPFSLMTAGLLGILAIGEDRGTWRCLGLGSLAAAGLAAYQGLPFLDLLRHSTRSVILDPETLLKFSLTPRQLLKEVFCPQWSWWAPGLQGDPAVVNFYVGGLAVVLAAWGAWKGHARDRRLSLITGVALLLTLGASLPGYRFLTPLHFFRFPATWLLIVAFGFSLLAAAGVARIRNGKAAWWTVAALALDLVLFAQNPTAAWLPPAFVDDPPARMATLPQHPFPTRLYHSPLAEQAGLGETLRTAEDYVELKESLSPSMGVRWGLREMNSYQVLRLKQTQSYLDALAQEGPTSPRLAWAGAAALMTSDSARAATSLVAVPLATPRPPVYFVDGEAAGKILSLSYRPGQIRLHLQVMRPGALVFSEVDDGHWRLEIDGHRRPTERFQNTFLATPLTEGDHEVVWDYRPLPFMLGTCLSLITAVAMSVFVFRFAR